MAPKCSDEYRRLYANSNKMDISQPSAVRWASPEPEFLPNRPISRKTAIPRSSPSRSRSNCITPKELAYHLPLVGSWSIIENLISEALYLNFLDFF